MKYKLNKVKFGLVKLKTSIRVTGVLYKGVYPSEESVKSNPVPHQTFAHSLQSNQIFRRKPTRKSTDALERPIYEICVIKCISCHSILRISSLLRLYCTSKQPIYIKIIFANFLLRDSKFSSLLYFNHCEPTEFVALRH